MDNLSNCQFYCLNLNDENKRDDMINRFNTLNIDIKFYFGVDNNDKRLNRTNNKYSKRQLSMLYGHLDILYHFYHKTDKKFAIICEDDIHIHQDIKNILHKIIIDFSLLDLDILLLGYMLPYKLRYRNLSANYKLKCDMPNNSMFKYHNYPNYLSGTQMYMISRKHAKYLLDSYYDNNYFFDRMTFIPDKILTKIGNRALIYPMLAIENNKQTDRYHKFCRDLHDDGNYI